MTDVNIFEAASRAKLTFKTERGQLGVEYLWDLPLASLDAIAIDLDKRIRDTPSQSFIKASVTQKDLTQILSFEIVKHIINVRMNENKIKAEKAEKATQRKMLREAIAEKENENLLSGDVDTLKKRLASLED